MGKIVIPRRKILHDPGLVEMAIGVVRVTSVLLLAAAGFRVQAHSGILFIPGWLRMADLLCHTRWQKLAGLTGALVRPFAWLYRHVPAVRRHGYLLVCVVTKPLDASSS